MRSKNVGKKVFLLSSFVSVSITSMPVTVALADETTPSTTTASVMTGPAQSTDLNVGNHQTLAIDFGLVGSQGLVLSGNLTNSGTIFAFTSDPKITTANFSAYNISNLQGGLITSAMPQGGLAGLNINPAYFANNLSLSFTALNNFVNQGHISSAGNLSIIAGNTLTNTNSAVMTAMQNIDISAMSSIVNSGLIASQVGNLLATTALLNNQNGIMQSLNGSISVQALLGQVLNVNNTLGQISALKDVTFANKLMQSSGSTVLEGIGLSGGAVTANAINFVSPTNGVNIDVDRLNGTVHIDSAATSVQVQGGELNIGSANLTNDPTFLNGNGSLTLTLPSNTEDLSGTLNGTFSTSGQNFIALASGDVTITGSGTIDASSSGTTSIIRIGAGVTFDGSGNVLTAGSSTGGSISMSGINLTNHGDSIVLIAKNDNHIAGKGNISVASVNTSGYDAASAGGAGGGGGAVTVTAASIASLGVINTSGGIGANGANGSTGTDYTGTSGSTGGDGGAGVPVGDGGAGANGGNGVTGGAGGAGGGAGSISISTGGNLLASILGTGGAGGLGGNGGNGGNGQKGGKGGDMYVAGTAGTGGTGGYGGNGAAGGNGGAGGSGAQVSISSNGSVSLTKMLVYGGDGGDAGSGGAGGRGGDGGDRGSGYGAGVAGSGGNGNYGGNGGAGGRAGAGGTGQSVQITAVGPIGGGLFDGSGGLGGIGGIGGSGGAGGAGTAGGGNLVSGSGGNAGNGGSGGSGGGGGNGATGGNITLTSTGDQVALTSSIYTVGGSGGFGGFGGTGNNAGAAGGSGTSAFGGGDGGQGGDGGGAGSGGGGGAGGNGGQISVNALKSISIAGNVHSYGGDGGNGGQAGVGGAASSGSNGASAVFGFIGLGVGGDGGTGGKGGSSGAGGGGGGAGTGGNISLVSTTGDISVTPSGGAISGVTKITSARFNDATLGKDVFLQAGGTSLTISSATGFQVGQRVLVSNSFVSERVKVTSISGNTLTVSPLKYTYPTYAKLGDPNAALGTPTISIAPSGVISSGGTGGAGGNGGNGGNGGDGATSGVGISFQGGANGQFGAGSYDIGGGAGFTIGQSGTDGGKGGVGGVGGLGGAGGSAGDIVLLAPVGAINVDGNVQAIGNNGGNPGDYGLNGRDGQSGSTNVYFGLSINFNINGSTSSFGGPNLGLGGSITISNFTLGLMPFTNPLTYATTPDLPISSISVYINYNDSKGESQFNLEANVGLSKFNPSASAQMTVGGQTSSVDFKGPVGQFAGALSQKYLGIGNSANQGQIYFDVGGSAGTGGTSTKLATGLQYGEGIKAPTLFNTISTTSQITGGASFGQQGPIDFQAPPPSNGGNIHILAANNINVGGTINALGGTSVSLVKTNIYYSGPDCQPCFNLTPVAAFGAGGIVRAEGSAITVSGTGSSLPPGFTTGNVPVVSGGSVTFITKYNDVSFLIKPITFSNLSWPTQLGLNLGNGKGAVVVTSPVTIIRNNNGDVDLGTLIVNGKGTYSVNGDLVVLATGNIIASNIGNSGSIVNGGSTTRPTGSIIMAAGDNAARYTYGSNYNNQGWLVLGAPSDTGGDIYLPNVSIGGNSSYLVALSAHAAPLSNNQPVAPYGSVYTGSVMASTGQFIPGTTLTLSSQDIGTTGSYKADIVNLNSAFGNVGKVDSPLDVNAPFLGAKGVAGVYLNELASTFNLLKSQGGSFSLSSKGNINVVGGINGGAIAISSKTISITSSVTALGTNGVIGLTTVGDITDSIGLSKLSGSNILLQSKQGDIKLGSLSAAESIILNVGAAGGKITANSLDTKFLGVFSGTGGLTVNGTTAQNFVVQTTGDVNVTGSNAITVGGVAKLPSLSNNFTLTAPGITVTGALQANHNIVLDASGSTAGVFLNRNLVAGDSVTVKSGGGIYQNDAYIDSPTLTLVAGTDIGEALHLLVSNATTLNLPSTGRNFYLYNDNSAHSLNLNTGFTGKNLILVEAGDLHVNGVISATEKVALSSLNGGSLFLSQNVTGDSVLLQGTNNPPSIAFASNGAIQQTGGVVTAKTLYLYSGSGGTSSTYSDGALHTNVIGTVEVSSFGATSVNNTGAISNLHGTTQSLNFNNDTDLAVAKLSSSKGDLKLTTASGTLSVIDNSEVIAHSGKLILNNKSLQGKIAIGKNDLLFSDSPSGGVVDIFLGTTGGRTNTIVPANVSVTTVAGGKVFFGNQSITSIAPTNLVISKGTNSVVSFDTGGSPSASISLGGNTLIGTSVLAPLTSLDLSDPAIATAVKAQQNAGLIGGSLILNNANQAVGGSAIILQTDISTDISALNVPQNVALTFNNFLLPLTVSITGSSTSNQAVLNGSVNFVGTVNANNTLNIVSAQNPIVLSQSASGFIFTAGSLAVTATGSATLNGAVNGTFSLQTTAGSSGNILVGGTGVMSSGTGAIKLIADGGLSVAASIYASGDVILKSNANLVETGNITSSGANVQLISNAGTLLNSGTINAPGASVLLSADGNLTNTGMITATNLTFQTTGSSGAISQEANASLSGTATLTAAGAGGVSTKSGTMLNSTGKLTVSGSAVSLNGSVSAGSAQVTSTSAAIAINGAVNTQNGGAIFDSTAGISSTAKVTANGDVSMTANGKITLGASLTAGGKVTLQGNGPNGAVAVNSSSTAYGGIDVVTTGLFSNAPGATIYAYGNSSITAADVSLSGTAVQASGYNVTLNTINPLQLISVGGTTNGAFNVTTAQMRSITAGSLTFGAQSNKGGITVAGPINVSGAGQDQVGPFNLNFITGGNYSAAGQTILLGAKSLAVNAGGTVDTGTVTGGPFASVSALAGSNVTVSGDISAPFGTINLKTPNGSVSWGANKIGGGSSAPATISLIAGGAGSLVGTSAVTGSTVNLAAGVNAGTTGAGLTVNANTLTAFAGGDVFINTSGSITVAGHNNAGGAGGFRLISPGSIVLASGATVAVQGSGPLSLSTTSTTGSITQMGSETTLIGRNVQLSTGNLGASPGTAVSNIGSSYQSIVLSSGAPATPLGLTISAGGSAYLKSSNSNGTGDVAFTGTSTVRGQVDLSAQGYVEFGSGAQLSTGLGAKVTAGGAIRQVAPGTVLIGPSIALVAGGSIGSANLPFKVAGDSGITIPVNLTAVAGGDAYLQSDANVNLGNSSAGGQFGLTGKNIVVSTVKAASGIGLNAGQTGTITQMGGSGLLSPVISLTAASIGSQFSPLSVGNIPSTAATKLSANAVNSAFISSMSAVTLQGSSSAGGQFNLNATGPVVLDSGDVTAGSSAVISSGAGISATVGAGTIISPVVTFTAGSSGVGTALTPVKVASGSQAPVALKISSGGASSVSSTSSVELQSSYAYSGFSVETTGANANIAVPGYVYNYMGGRLNLSAGGTLVLSPSTSLQSYGSMAVNANNGSLNITGNLAAYNGLMSLSATGNITTIGSVAAYNGGIAITAGGAISTAGSVYQYGSGNLNLTANGGGIANTAYMTASGPSGFGGLEWLANGNISTSGTVSGNTILFKTAPSNGSIAINGYTAANNGATLETGGAGVISNSIGGALYSYNGPVSLTAAGLALSGAAINAGANSVTINSNNLQQLVSVGGVGGVGFSVTQATLNAINAGTLVIGRVGQTGGIVLTGALNASSYNLTMITDASYSSQGNAINLGAYKALNVTAGGSLNSSAVNGTYGSKIALTSGSGGLVSGALTALYGSVDLKTNNNGSIVLNNAINATGSSVNINANGAGSITGTGLVTAASLNLTSGTGDIGTNNGALNTAASNMSANTGGTGSVYLSNTGMLTLGSSSSGATFSLTNAGMLTTGSVQTNAPINSTTGSLSLVQTSGGQMTINGNLTANGGSIVVQNSDTVNGSIVIGKGAQITTLVDMKTPLSNGTVSVFIGAAPVVVSGTAPAGLNVRPATAPGNYFFGNSSAGIMVVGPAGASAATVDAHGRDVIISTPNAMRTITLNQNVLLKADPPGAGVTDSLSGNVGALSTVPILSPFVFGDEPKTLAAPASRAVTEYTAVPAASTASPASNRLPLVGSISSNVTVLPGANEASRPTRSLSELLGAGRTAPEDVVVFDAKVDETELPIAYVNGPAGTPTAIYASGAGVEYKPAAAGTKGHDEPMSLQSGSVLFAPDRNITVETPFCTASIAKGSVVLVVASSESVALYNMHDAHSGDVFVSLFNKKLTLTPGTHVLLTDRSVSSLEEVNILGSIGHRRIETHNHGGNIREFSSEFSIPSAINSLKRLRSMQGSSDARDLRIIHKVLKTAAVLNQMGMGKGAYKPVPKRTYQTALR